MALSTDPLEMARRLVARVAASDPTFAQQLLDLGDASLFIECTAPAFTLLIRCTGGELTFAREAGESGADVAISGTAREFLTFLRARRRGEPTPSGVVRISGDLAVAERVQALVSNVSLDIESMIAARIGDVPTHNLMRALAASSGFLRARSADLREDLSEYLRYELALLPSAEDVEAFAADTRALRTAVDRAEARLSALEGKRKKDSPA